MYMYSEGLADFEGAVTGKLHLTEVDSGHGVSTSCIARLNGQLCASWWVAIAPVQAVKQFPCKLRYIRVSHRILKWGGGE